ncbi:MAG: hypothetical protein AAGF54_06810, partial [Pseudomonadota bacterium]
ENEGAKICKDLEYGEIKSVNRSLTESEYKFQMEFNKHTKHSSTYISDVLVNHLPNIKSEIPFIHEETHIAVSNWIRPVIDEVNKSIDSENQISIESYDELRARCNTDKGDSLTYTNGQIELLVSSICKRRSTVKDKEIAQLRDIALKIEQMEGLSLHDAKALMELAHRLRPKAPLIRKKVKEYRASLDTDAS